MGSKATKVNVKPKPFLYPEFCKACGRCIEPCKFDAITMGTEINPATGLTFVQIDLENCTACGLCATACPEPFGLRMRSVDLEEIDNEALEGVHSFEETVEIFEQADYELEDPSALFGARETSAPKPVT